MTAYSNLEVSAGQKIMDECLQLAESMTPGKVFENRPVKPSNEKCPIVGPELK